MPTLSKNNISIYYETLGDKNNPCVILINGIGSQLISWPSKLVQGLVAAGFYVVIFDNRDVGFSSYYDHCEMPGLMEAVQKKQAGKLINIPYTLEDMATDVLILMDQLVLAQTHLVGISMGGQIAQHFAISYPERLLSLTLIATSSGDSGLPPPEPTILDFFFNVPEDDDDLESAMNRHIQQHKLYTHPDDFDEESVKKTLYAAYQRAYHPPGNQRQLLAMIFSEPRGNHLKSVTTPALIVHGDYDPLVSIEHGQQLADCIPNSRLLIIEKMGHTLPSRVSAILIEELIKHFRSASNS